MKKALIMVIAILIVCACGFFLWPKISHYNEVNTSVPEKILQKNEAIGGLTDVVLPNRSVIHVKIANTPQTRIQGLSGVPALDYFDGMLFIFEAEHRAGFWMIEMKFPLDIIYLNKNKEIVEIHRNVLPCKDKNNCPIITAADENVQFVLEVAAGEAARQSLAIGQSLIWK